MPPEAGSVGEGGVMYEIRTADQVGAVLAVAGSPSELFDAIEAIEDLTAAQVARNAEGASRLMLELVVYEDDQPVMWHASSVRTPDTAW
jgi:hypothetical protein